MPEFAAESPNAAPFPPPVLLDALAVIPEEEVWLAKQKSRQTRRAYRLDVRHFMRALGITTTEQLRQVDHRAVIAWERMQREQASAAPSTVRRRFAALSSLFKHRMKHGGLAAIRSWTWSGRRSIATRAAPPRSRKPRPASCWTRRWPIRWPACDRAILSVGLQVGFRRAEIATLDVGDLHQNRAFDASCARAGGGRRSRSIRRRRSASAPTSPSPATATTGRAALSPTARQRQAARPSRANGPGRD